MAKDYCSVHGDVIACEHGYWPERHAPKPVIALDTTPLDIEPYAPMPEVLPEVFDDGWTHYCTCLPQDQHVHEESYITWCGNCGHDIQPVIEQPVGRPRIEDDEVAIVTLTAFDRERRIPLDDAGRKRYRREAKRRKRAVVSSAA